MGFDYLAAGLSGLATHYIKKRLPVRGGAVLVVTACGVTGTPADRLTADVDRVNCWRCGRSKIYRAALDNPQHATYTDK